MTTASSKRYSEEWIRKRLLQGEEVRFPKRRPKKDRTIRAEWLREAFEAGAKIAVRNAVIVDPLDVRYLTVEGEVVIKGSVICDPADFSYATFRRVVSFGGTTFDKGVTFAAAGFESDVIFSQATFGGEASFAGARFEAEARFDSATFKGKADFISMSVGGRAVVFSGATFEGEAIFTLARITGEAFFSHATFEGDAGFTAASVDEEAFFFGVTFKATAIFYCVNVGRQAIFTGVTFEGEANFRRMNVGDLAVFRRATFEGEARFAGARITGDAFFDLATFKGRADFVGTSIGGQAVFSRAAFEGEASFAGARFAGDAYFVGTALGGLISFRETTFRTVFFTDEDEGVSGQLGASSTLDLRGCTYERIQIRDGASRFRWLLPLPQGRRRGQIDWQSLLARQESPGAQPYTQLERAFRAAGQHTLADEVYFQRRWWEARTRSFVRDPVGLVLLALVGYGVRRWFLAVWIAIALGIGTLAFHQEAAVQPHEGDVPLAQLPSECPDPDTCRLSGPQAFWFALNTFLPVEIPAGGEWRPSSEGVRGLPDITYASLANILTIFGWVFVPVGIAALTGILGRGRGRE